MNSVLAFASCGYYGKRETKAITGSDADSGYLPSEHGSYDDYEPARHSPVPVVTQPTQLFSKRANVFLGDPEFLMGCIKRCGEDAFDKDSNKEGFINLGTAVNSLCWDIIKERLEKGDMFSPEASLQQYTGFNGTKDLLRVAAQFLSDRMAEVKIVLYESCIAFTFIQVYLILNL